MKYKKKLSIFLFALLISLVSIGKNEVLAIPKEGDVSIQSIHGVSEGVFSDKDGLWEPGMKKVNEFAIINNSSDDIEFKELNIIDNILKNTNEYIEIKENTNISILDNGRLLYKGTFKDAYNNRSIKLDNSIIIKHGEDKILEMKIESLDVMDNIAINTRLDFSIGVTYTLLKSNAEINLGIDNETVLNSKKDNYNIPVTGDIIGSLAKMSMGIGLLLSGSIISIKPCKKGEKSND